MSGIKKHLNYIIKLTSFRYDCNFNFLMDQSQASCKIKFAISQTCARRVSKMLLCGLHINLRTRGHKILLCDRKFDFHTIMIIIVHSRILK